MDRQNRQKLEARLRDVENKLSVAREEAQAAHAALERSYDDLVAAGDLDSAKGKAILKRYAERADAAKDALASVASERDAALYALAGTVDLSQGNAPTANPMLLEGLGVLGASNGPRGVPIGFSAAELRAAVESWRSKKDPVRQLGPDLPFHGDVTQGGMEFFAATIGESTWPSAGITTYDLHVYEALRELTLVHRLFPARAIDTKSLEYFRVTTLASGAEWVAEGAQKPTSDPAATAYTATPEVIALMTSITVQAFFNVADGFNAVLNELVAGVLLAIDDAVIGGNGAGVTPTGIVNTAGVSTITRNTTDERILAALHRGAAAVRNADFRDPTHILIHPTDLHNARVEESTAGGFLLAGAQAAQEDFGGELWGMTVVQSTRLTPGTAIVINPQRFGWMVNRRPVVVEANAFGDSEWQYNQLGLRCEAWTTLACLYPTAACVVTL